MGKNHSVTYINDQNQFLNTHKTENVTYSSVNTELKENVGWVLTQQKL